MLGRRVVAALLIIGLVASGYVAVQRYRVEAKNRAVEIVVDWDEVQQLAAATGNSPERVLNRFKKAGVTSVAITEQTVRDAISNGLITIEPNSKILISEPYSRRITDYLQGLMPGRDVARSLVENSIGLQYLQQLPIGFPEEAVSAVKSQRMGIVARLVNYPGATPKAIDFMMADARKCGAKVVIFQGDTVLGFKGAVENTAEALRANDLCFGRVEFSKQKGDIRLAEEAKDRLIVVHSITQAEMPTLSESAIVDRFQKGVRERSVRICYIRMYESAGEDIVHDNAAYIAAIAGAITKAGYTITTAHTQDEVLVTTTVKILAGLGVAAGAIWLLSMIVGTPGLATSIGLILLCGGFAACGELGRKVVALLAALIFPVVATVWASRGGPASPAPASGVLWRSIGRLAGAIAITACGGMLVVGLLSGRDFMLRTDQFMGVKLAHLLPIVALGLLYAGGIAWESESWPKIRERFWGQLREIGANPVLIWQAAAMLAAVVVVGFMVARSGNDSGLGVSPIELRFRSVLDKILYVRPRTKEFLLGYPALLAGIAFALRGRRQWAAPLVVVGSIGLISALNTFCHIHTPLQLSLLRVVNGGVVGLIVAIVFYELIKNLPGREK